MFIKYKSYFAKMAAVVDRQNAKTHGYKAMSSNFKKSIAFQVNIFSFYIDFFFFFFDKSVYSNKIYLKKPQKKAALDLVLQGTSLPNGYTEPVLHPARVAFKNSTKK